MGVLAITQNLFAFERKRDLIRKPLAQLRLKILADCKIVLRSMSKSITSELLSGRKTDLTARAFKLCDDRSVLLRACNHCNIMVIFRSRPNHRRAANIDVLNHFLVSTFGIRSNFCKRIKITNNHVNWMNVMLFNSFHMLSIITDRKYAPVDFGMQGFNPAV